MGVLEFLLGPEMRWRDLAPWGVDVLLVAYLVFRVLLLIRGTRAVQVLTGLLLLGAANIGAQWAGFETLEWLLTHFLTYSVIFGAIVLFQADIRRGLAELGKGRVLNAIAGRDRAARRSSVEAVVQAAVELSRCRRGALIVLERSADLGEICETGVKLDAANSAEVLLSVFYPGSPLHDGAVIIRNGRVVAARCLLPLTSTATASELGTRHRAALGLAEEVDAAVVVVSEERGEISLAVDGELRRGLDARLLRDLLHTLFIVERTGTHPTQHDRPGSTPQPPRPAEEVR